MRKALPMSASFAWGRLVRGMREARAAIRSMDANSPEFERQLTWLFGSPRSGSTWLMRLLAAHEGVLAINEPLIGWYLAPFLSDLPGGDARSLDVSNFTLSRVQARKYSQFFSEQFAEVWVRNLGRMMRERFYQQAVWDGGGEHAGKRVLIQEPNGSQAADVIMRALPQARLLFLQRDGRDVVDSDLAANLEGSWVSRDFPGLRGIAEGDRLAFVAQSAQKWRWRTEVVQAALATHGGPSLVVRYEDLLREPALHLRQIFDWLGLEVREPEIQMWVEQNSFERMSGGSAGPSEFFRQAQPGSWRQNLRPDEQTLVQELLGPTLRELGYEA
jgi:Sulfotransferase family